MRATPTIARGPVARATRRPPGRADPHKRWTDRRGPDKTVITNNAGLATTNPYGYASGYNEPATGLVKFGDRYYNPVLGQFTQPGPKSTYGNYTYANDDPIDSGDPTGDGLSFGISLCLGVCINGSVDIGSNGVGLTGSIGAGPDAGVSGFAEEDPSDTIEAGPVGEVDCEAGVTGGAEFSEGGVEPVVGATTDSQLGCEASAGYSTGAL